MIIGRLILFTTRTWELRQSDEERWVGDCRWMLEAKSKKFANNRLFLVGGLQNARICAPRTLFRIGTGRYLTCRAHCPLVGWWGFFGARYVPLGTTPVRLVDDGHHDDSSGDEADTTLAAYNNGRNSLSFLRSLFISHTISRIRLWTSLNHDRLTPLCAVSESAMEATSQLTRMGRPARGVVGAHAGLPESWRW